MNSSAPRRLPISVICLTLNEERNIRATLESVRDFVDEIFVLDAGSTDGTQEIARSYGAQVFFHAWENYAKQYIWALDNLPFRNDWVIRLDADERWSPEGFAELERAMAKPGVAGVYVRKKILFMGRWIRHGDFYPNLFLLAFNRNGASIEDRWMDEHIRVAGETVVTKIDVIEANYDRQENITGFVAKHNSYATREAIDILLAKREAVDSVGSLTGTRTERKRWLKENLYNRMPLFVRPFLYFFYRYVVKLGFLDGKEGFILHFLQGLWYRFLVDAKVLQLERRMRDKGQTLEEAVADIYNVRLAPAAKEAAC